MIRTYPLSHTAKKPLYEQLYDAVRQDILSGRLSGGEKLPSKRALAEHLSVSKITVETAYAQLLAEGYITSRQRAGYFVEQLSALELAAPEIPAAQPAPAPAHEAPAVDTAAASLFPFSVWARLMRSVLLDQSLSLLRPVPNTGLAALRQAIADDLLSRRGLHAAPEQIVVGAGAEYFYDLLIQFLGRTRRYALENPGHRKLAQVCANCGAQICPIDMDADGVLPDALERSGAEVLHISPSHHYPTGAVMPISRRQALMQWLAASPDRYLIEVSFRLIGDFPESYTSDHLGYVNWIETESYTLKTGSTVYDLFTTALKQAGLSSTGAEKGYVRSITAPAVLGGYTLSEFDNGSGSGWMFTVNGTHGNSALTDHVLKNGDRVVWHYVDNYATEEKKFTWLEAEDITPSEYVRRHISDVAVAGKNGSIEPTLTTGDLGRTVTFKFKPDAGYRVRDVKVNGKSVGAVDSYTYSGLKIYSRITVEFTNGTMPFTDVHTNDWFYNDVAYVYEAGLFAGTSDTTFSPYASMTRGMLVTVLYRLEGRPSVTGTSVFDDVARGEYYEKAVIWAAEHKIVNGTGGSKFSPDANVTREQMAAILYRYAQYKGYRTNSRAGLSGFADYQTVSSYAETPMQWAVAEKLINGSNGSLLPRGNATRAQVAAILHRFVENIVK